MEENVDDRGFACIIVACLSSIRAGMKIAILSCFMQVECPEILSVLDLMLKCAV